MKRRKLSYTHKCTDVNKNIYKHTVCKHCCGFRRSQCSCLPAAVCVLWGRGFGRGLVLGLMGGLKAWLRSLPLSLSLSALPPPHCCVTFLARVCVCVEVSEGRAVEKSLPALCVGNPDKPKHNTTHCSFVICKCESKWRDLWTKTLKSGLSLKLNYLLKGLVHPVASIHAGLICPDFKITVSFLPPP